VLPRAGSRPAAVQRDREDRQFVAQLGEFVAQAAVLGEQQRVALA
jgi:hypothetical protein